MNGHQFGTRSNAERDAWKQKRADWQRNNPPRPLPDDEDDE